MQTLPALDRVRAAAAPLPFADARRFSQNHIPVGRGFAWLASLVGAIACLASPAAAQPAGPGGGGAQGPMEVGVIELKKERTPYSVTVAGRAVAFEQVDVRPRVAGVVSEILYEPGKKVAVGDPLFKIEDATYAAQVASAEADVQSARAELAFAASKLRRYKKIETTGVTGADVEEAAASELKAKAP